MTGDGLAQDAQAGLVASLVDQLSRTSTFVHDARGQAELERPLVDGARQRRVKVDQLRPGRGHHDPDHAVVERAHLRLPADPLLGRHLVGAVHLEVLVRDAVDDVQLGPPPDQQDLGRVHLGVDRQGNIRVLAQGRELRGVLRGAHDDLRAVPGERDRDVAVERAGLHVDAGLGQRDGAGGRAGVRPRIQAASAARPKDARLPAGAGCMTTAR